jgi:hypothetical protein
MSETTPLILEIVSGPLDGTVLTLNEAAEWTAGPGSLLSFPWDGHLAAPQARFAPAAGGWTLQGFDTPHGTYRVFQDESVREPVPLKEGDLLRAGWTWILVRKLG